MNPASTHEAGSSNVMGAALAARAVATTAALRIDPQATAHDIIDLTRSQSLPAPEHVQQAARDALARGETHYTVRPGVPALRAAFAARSTAAGFPATVDGTIVTNGGSEALFIALQATLQPGDRVLVAGPVRPNVVAMLHFIGARVERLPANIASAPSLAAAVRDAREATLLLLAAPSPISGVDLAPGDLEATLAAAIERGTIVVLDHSAFGCRYDGRQPVFGNPELGGQVVTFGSLSFSHGLDGWRVGYVSAPAGRIAAMRELKQAMSICTTAVSQFAALAALEGPTGWLSDRREMFTRRRDAAIATLHAAGLEVIQPDAYTSLLIDTRSIDSDDRAVARQLRDGHRVIVEPASLFGAATSGYVRIDLGAADQALSAGIARIANLGRRATS